MKTQGLSGLKTNELVGIFNGLVPDAPLSGWKRGKGVLIARIEAARKASGKSNGKDVSASPMTDTVPEAAEDAPSNRKVAKATGKQDTRTIRLTAVELLCKVEYFEDRNEKSGPDNVVGPKAKNARSVGVPYDEIIRRIRKEFPECQTTVACLRWYSVKIRVEEPGYEILRLPQRRPRAKPKAA